MKNLGDTPRFLHSGTPIDDAALQLVALTPTRHLGKIADAEFLERLTDRDFIRIAVFLARKSYEEGGCAIGAVVVRNKTNAIIGKGHNRHFQDNRVYWHGETDAIQDAGSRTDFSETTLFTTLTPCSICTAMTFSLSINRVVIGNRLNGANAENEEVLRSKGILVDVLEDEMGILLYSRYVSERPEQDARDWQGEAGVRRMTTQSPARRPA